MFEHFRWGLELTIDKKDSYLRYVRNLTGSRICFITQHCIGDIWRFYTDLFITCFIKYKCVVHMLRRIKQNNVLPWIHRAIIPRKLIVQVFTVFEISWGQCFLPWCRKRTNGSEQWKLKLVFLEHYRTLP